MSWHSQTAVVSILLYMQPQLRALNPRRHAMTVKLTNEIADTSRKYTGEMLHKCTRRQCPGCWRLSCLFTHG
jgi:hypothetical protein